ncbi:hypothetical protein [Phyllobacterium zundukense]|jgi:hypothetical protein|uniref:Uncharacterized protein n=2 Tax=Phyllobacterium zundukense TaxID=1867719 RepID=A0ACD4D568_9HYPH|nr:hypothetical protein [Phyllobacterium zundukense]UXN58684.1 hypothetical protein N8E88_11930 [Phyllobacterium zundukense]UXN61002.1 hypothetical protein N8E88_12905 [Phyllobacterium zundukense]
MQKLPYLTSTPLVDFGLTKRHITTSANLEDSMAAQHVKEIDAAIKELISSRRQEILQIAQNGANPGPLKNLVDIQTAIDALYRAREQEGAHS